MGERIDEYDVTVVGCGMAGLAAGIRAGELGLSTAILEKAPEEERGGHTRYSKSFRVPSANSDLPERGYEFVVPDYSAEDFYDDIMEQTHGRADPETTRTLVSEAGPTIEWLTDQGADWEMEPAHVGYTVACVYIDGEEFVTTMVEAAEDHGAMVFYDAEARSLSQTDTRRVAGVNALLEDEPVTFETEAVIIAGGGYEADERKRTLYYGRGYDAMKVRGSPYNTGEPIDMALDAGARAVGQWSGAHMSLIDKNAPDARGGGNRIDGYHYCVIINHDGERFLDEGEDAPSNTYASFGRRVFEQPKNEAFLIADSSMEGNLSPAGPSDPTRGDTVAAVLRQLGCEDPERGQRTVEEYNDACDPRHPFNPEEMDGNRTTGIMPPKSNWAIPLDDPPYVGYPLTGGITFSFGGVDTTTDAEVLDTRGLTIPGLYAAGNSVGGLFYDNYISGASITNSAVFGRIAAESAAAYLD